MKNNVLIFFVSIGMTQQAISQSEKFRQLVYTVPAGWQLAKYDNGALITAPQLQQKEFLGIQIMEPVSFSGTMQQALEECYNKTCTELQVTKMREVNGANYNALQPKKSFKGWEYIRCSGGVQVNNGTPYPDEFGLDLFVIKMNGRYERIGIIKSRNTCGGLSRYYPSDRLEYAKTIENFLFSIRFDDWQEQNPAPGLARGPGIVGVWAGLSLSVGTTKPGAQLGAELKGQRLILFNNGQVYFGNNFPAEGLDELNTWIRAESNRRDWGTYTFNSNKGMLRMPYGDIPIRLENDKLIVTTNQKDHAFIKFNPVDQAKFNGTYVLSEWKGTIPSITFTPDGRFTDNGAVRILYHEYTDCLNAATKPGSGTYEIKNYSIIFNYADGRKIKLAFPGFDFKKNDANALLTVSYNDDVLRKQ